MNTGRELTIGRHQAAVLMVLYACHPRSVEAYVLARIADAAGDLTRGQRVLASLERRELVRRHGAGEYRVQDVRYRYKPTTAGVAALARWLENKRVHVDAVARAGIPGG